MKQLNPRWRRLLLVLGLISLLALVSCKPTPTTTVIIEPKVDSTEIAAADLPYPEPADKSVHEPVPEVSVSQQPSDVQPPQDAYPAPGEDIPRLKTELEATDPSIVSLASGEIQLVEFFAFW